MASQEAGKRFPRLLMVSAANGERREIKAGNAGHLEWCAFSPDSRFIACSLYPNFGTAGRARILVWPVQGGEPHLIQEEAPRSSWEASIRTLRLLDWTADGRYLTISSTQSGKSALYLFPVNDGQAAGPPVLIRSGRYESGVTTKAGALVYQVLKPGDYRTVHAASLDTEGRPGTWQQLERSRGEAFLVARQHPHCVQHLGPGERAWPHNGAYARLHHREGPADLSGPRLYLLRLGEAAAGRLLQSRDRRQGDFIDHA